MIRLGLTGSIATGKSTVLRAFSDLGYPVYSADDTVHDLYRGEAVGAVEAVFPGVARDGIIDRALLSERLIGHPERIRTLEAVVHPLVRGRMNRFAAEAEAAGAPLAVFDIPLLFETGHDYGFDAIAVTFCEPEEQRSRALARPGMSVEKLDAILARQLPQDQKKARADHLIDTSGSVEQTRASVAALARKLIEG